MPLVRVEVRNEYGLGMPELYTQINTEDPKAVLDGVAVAGLVGLLRQLGDLAEFAAEIFHGLQEQMLMTSSRSHKLIERVHNIESALPPLEQAILGQRSHLHFAYTAGSKWHTRLKTEQNHFIYSDLPCCIMDSYENCYDPPRLHNLDKFDTGGPGSCFRRYSDPTYFKRSSVGPYEAHLQTIPREKKKKRSSLRHRDVTRGVPVIMHGERTDLGALNIKEKTPPCQDLSTIQPEVDHLTSVDPRNDSDYVECIFHPSHSTQSEDNNFKELSFVSLVNQDSYLDSASLDETIDNINLTEDSRSKSNYITWDEKLEIIDSTHQPNEPIEIPCTSEKMDTEVMEDLNPRSVDHIDDAPVVSRGQHDEIESETDSYMDALNTVESESENDLNCHTKRELKQNSNMNKEIHLDDKSMKSTSHESHMEANGSSNIENHEGSSQVAGISSTSLTTPEKLESEVKRNDINSEAVAGSSESPNPSWSTSVGQTKVSSLVMFWTNGGLLGLEPSKPPDSGLPAVAAPDPVEETKTNEIQAIQHSGQQNTVNDIKPEASVAQEHGGNSASNEMSQMTPGTDDSVNPSRMFEFRNRLLENGFRKQISLVGDERLASSVKSEVPESPRIQKRYPTVTVIPFISPCSPPLEHMKISFQPIGGFETCKLKLAFPDGNNNNDESNGLMFPSFQLVPEHAMPDEFASDSDDDDDDDDTFCRSSPYASDDCHSNASESNSEQWDSIYSPGMNNRELDDAESVSSSFVNGIRFQQGFPDRKNYGYQSLFTEDGVQASQHGLLLDIPDFDSMKASLTTNDVEGPTQSAPPLPPVEWRGVKSSPRVTMEKEDGLSEALTYGLNLTPPVPTKQDNVVETDRIKVKDRNESNRTIDGKVGEQKDDFLQQIRRKSRNLRPISTTQPTTPAGQTSVKVTAILEKASSIRQVVGSDDGEDNWSDT